MTDPRFIYDDQHTASVVADLAALYNRCSLGNSRNQPTIDELLNELDGIKLQEPVEIEISPRYDRYSVDGDLDAICV